MNCQIERLKNFILDIYNKNKEVNLIYLTKKYPKEYSEIKNIFRTVSEMKTKLDLDIKITYETPKSIIIEEIKEVYDKYGYVTIKLLKKENKTSSCRVFSKFGGFASILKELEIPLKQGQRKFISKEDLDNEIFRLVNEFGYISKPIMEKYSSINTKVVNRIYGNFSNMYKELNLKRHPSGRIPTDEELIKDVLRIYKKFGFITKDILEKESLYSATCFHDRFKKINVIKDKAGIKRKESESQSSEANYAIKKFEQFLNEKAIYEKTFDWLFNPQTNAKLRIDGFFEKYNLAIEYNGIQHYEFVKKYYKTQDDFDHRLYLDKLKAELLDTHNVKLITIHYKDIIDNQYIKQSLKNVGICISDPVL